MGYLEDLIAKRKEVKRKTSSKEGKFTVLGVDKFSDEDYVMGEYNTKEEAFEVANAERKKALTLASGPSIANRYYVYDASGRYIGEGKWI